MKLFRGLKRGFTPPFLIPIFTIPSSCYAHAFDERYDLPIPLSFFIWGALLTVAFTYILSVLFIKAQPTFPPSRFASDPESNFSVAPERSSHRLLFVIPQAIQIALQALVVSLLCFFIFVALFGPDNPLMNLSSHFVWVNWWIGVPLLFAIFGTVLHLIDPFEAIWMGLEKTMPNFWSGKKILPPAFTQTVGRWPATLGLLCWCWIEVVYPGAALPHQLGTLAIIWLLSGILGRFLLGRETWNEGWDFFRVYFSKLGEVSPLYCSQGAVYLDRPFIRLIENHESHHGNVAFIIAMLSTVLFDGLHSSPIWLSFQKLFQAIFGQSFDGNGYLLGMLGVAIVWALLYLVFLACCLLIPGNAHLPNSSKLSSTIRLAEIFAPTLIPIALAYHLAHNFSGIMIQGQNIIALLSDPFGKGWNLFGTANFYPNISIVDAKTVWYVALISIVAGHVISIYLSHLAALRTFKSAKDASRAVLPLTLAMIGFTAMSLLILAEPLIAD